MVERLEAAAAALDVGDPAAALDALLDAWRESRSQRIADLIDALTAICARALPKVIAGNRKKFHEAWLDLANANRAIDVDLLLDGWASQPWSKLRERVERLALRPDDPRIALALARFVEALPTTHSAGDATWTAILRIITQARDQRCRAPLAARLRAGGPGVFWQNLEPRLQKVLEALNAVKPTEPPDAAYAAVLARLEVLRRGAPLTEAVLRRPKPKGGGLNEAQLLERIYDAPTDDAARLVYADFLAERSDPRGELIALQFKPAPTQKEQRRIKDLLKLHGRRWCGPVEPAVAQKSEEFQRGFLSACHPDFRTPAQRASLLLHPAWNTLTRLWAWEDLDADFFVLHPLKGLELIDGLLSPALAGKLARRPKPYPRLRRAKLSLDDADREALRAVGEAGAFPALTWLGLQGTGQREEARPIETFEWLFGAPLMRRLETVELTFLQVNVIDWLKRVAAFPKLTHVQLSGWPAISFFRDGAGWLARPHPTPHGNPDARTLLEPIAKAGLLTGVQLAPARAGEEQARARLAAALQGVPVIEARA